MQTVTYDPLTCASPFRLDSISNVLASADVVGLTGNQTRAPWGEPVLLSGAPAAKAKKTDGEITSTTLAVMVPCGANASRRLYGTRTPLSIARGSCWMVWAWSLLDGDPRCIGAIAPENEGHAATLYNYHLSLVNSFWPAGPQHIKSRDGRDHYPLKVDLIYFESGGPD